MRARAHRSPRRCRHRTAMSETRQLRGSNPSSLWAFRRHDGRRLPILLLPRCWVIRSLADEGRIWTRSVPSQFCFPVEMFCMLPSVHDFAYAGDRNVIQVGKTRDESHFFGAGKVVLDRKVPFLLVCGLCHTTRSLGTGETKSP